MSMMSFMVEPPAGLSNARKQVELVAWLERHTPELRAFHVDDSNFGNTVLVLAKGGLQMRFVSDRGDLVVEVGDGRHWVDVPSVDAAVTGKHRNWPEFDPFACADQVTHAIAELTTPAAARATDEAALSSLGFAVDSSRSRNAG